ncbi:hypothetical protein CFE70_010658 [Pyrenophora teres f. teres 0-1]
MLLKLRLCGEIGEDNNLRSLETGTHKFTDNLQRMRDEGDSIERAIVPQHARGPVDIYENDPLYAGEGAVGDVACVTGLDTMLNSSGSTYVDVRLNSVQEFDDVFMSLKLAVAHVGELITTDSLGVGVSVRVDVCTSPTASGTGMDSSSPLHIRRTEPMDVEESWVEE